MNDDNLILDCLAAIKQAAINAEHYEDSADYKSVKDCAEVIKDNAEMIIDALIAHEAKHE
jgi:hypothetical protein